MKSQAWILVLCLSAGAHGAELIFPHSAAEFVQALPPPRQAVRLPQDCPPTLPKCERKGMDSGKGVADIVDDNPDLPKAGALIQFDYNSATILPASYNLLNELALALRGELNRAGMIIVGHTDYIGGDSFNQTLSEQRAAAVKHYLIARQGIEASRLRALGYGETRPLRGSQTAQSDRDREINRRVEIIRVQ